MIAGCSHYQPAITKTTDEVRLSKLLLGKWQTADDTIILEFLPNNIYRISKSPLNFNVHLRLLPDNLKGFHLMTKKGRWDLVQRRLAVTELKPYPAKNVWKAFDILRLDGEMLIIQFANYHSLELQHAK
jgi:hypothetical protein